MRKFGLSGKIILVIGLSMFAVFAALAVIVFSTVTSKFYDNLVQGNQAQLDTAVHMVEITSESLNTALDTAARTAVAMFDSHVSFNSERTTSTANGVIVPQLVYDDRPISPSDLDIKLDSFMQFAKADITIFVRDAKGDFIRASTTLKNDSGARAVGTPLAAGAALDSVLNKTEYDGIVMLFGRQYIARYVPIIENNEVTGIFFVGVEFAPAVEALSDSIANVKLGEGGYIYVIQGATPPAGAQSGNAIIHPSLKGQNILEMKSTDDVFINQEMAAKKQGILEYSLLENGKAVEKIAVFSYYPAWDWVAVGTLPYAELSSDATSIASSMIVPILGFLGILIALTFFVLRTMLVRPLNKFIETTANLTTGDGDLTRRIEIDSNDELGTLAGEFNTFIENTHDIIAQVKGSAEEVASANSELAATMEQLSKIFEQQTAQVDEVSSSMYSIRCVSDETTETLNNTRDVITETHSKSDAGKVNLNMVTESIHAIKQQTESLSETISMLGSATNEIDDMLTAINDIAGQTNLLALNASIEAARAGEAGHGFAVVADEVRKLAERTQNSTTQIAEIIVRVKAIPQNASKEVKETLESVSEGVTRTGSTGDFFEQIIALICKINDTSEQTVQKLADQCDMIAKNSDAVKDVAVGIDESNKAVAEVTQTVHHMQEMTEGLKMLVSRFQV
ncbi:MAG: methyl-accepting chemotaxis protein [Deferribacteraceae bacterium]|jgi:methyl-accepting chemotaxis protein|nr:methyl-accepting chemotaxis protein [Deferribacteraceae bacterium]